MSSVIPPKQFLTFAAGYMHPMFAPMLFSALENTQQTLYNGIITRFCDDKVIKKYNFVFQLPNIF
jgi:hypothetical protein